ncbi:hypothetical protein GIB67_037972 [Kingdonia uniflora]|uniref:E3 ubiquitin-protein ligase RMA n=1 Tax=Kingdonia uniflora TaxID=39325 RepID=A0A7J7LHL4_9MAGN|nr:hypothetical protein GIB67_037972 [Kingdonia uniflora]
METYVEPTETHYETDKDGSPLQKISTAEADNNSSWLECNICLDTTHDPVVTLCGHLYCWPCIYKWLNFQSNSAAPTQCPVCKASISETSLVPLYGRANKEKEGKRSSQGLDIPGRPPASPNGAHHSARPIPSPRQLHRNPYSGHPTTPSSQPPMFSLRGTLMSPSDRSGGITLTMEDYLDEATMHHETEKGGVGDDINGCFDCNICLESSQNPVITLCGHLYCRPCIYKWLVVQSDSPAPSQCPVCKASISETTLVPLYGRGYSSLQTEEYQEKKGKRPSVYLPRPQRLQVSPGVTHALSHHSPSPSPRQNHGHPASVGVRGMETTSLGEMAYAWMFGNMYEASMTFYPNSYHQLGNYAVLGMSPGYGIENCPYFDVDNNVGDKGDEAVHLDANDVVHIGANEADVIPCVHVPVHDDSGYEGENLDRAIDQYSYTNPLPKIVCDFTEDYDIKGLSRTIRKSNRFGNGEKARMIMGCFRGGNFHDRRAKKSLEAIVEKPNISIRKWRSKMKLYNCNF